jgi:hypothetical protein
MLAMLLMWLGVSAPKNELAFQYFTMIVPDEVFFTRNTLISIIHLNMNDRNGRETFINYTLIYVQNFVFKPVHLRSS